MTRHPARGDAGWMLRVSCEQRALVFGGATGGSRTHDPWLRRPVLYPAELRPRSKDVDCSRRICDFCVIARMWCKLPRIEGHIIAPLNTRTPSVGGHFPRLAAGPGVLSAETGNTPAVRRQPV